MINAFYESRMSSQIIKKEKDIEIEVNIRNNLELEYILSQMFIPFSRLLDKNIESDIYTGEEKIPFEQRHPIYKALLRIEFEDDFREGIKSITTIE